MTLYTNIARNKANSVLLLVIFLGVVVGLALAVGYVYDLTWLLPVVVVIAVIQAYAAYYHSDTIALAIARARPLTREENPLVHRLVENLALTAGLPMPSLYLIDDSAPNAFATGRDPAHASLAVTRGLLDKLTKPELEGVLAHELAHVGNYDIRFQGLVVVLVGIVTLLSDWTLRRFWWSGGRRSENGQGQVVMLVVGLVLIILAPLVATLIQLAVSRRREFLADSTGALLTRYPEGLAHALEKIAGDHEPLEVANKGTAHLYFANPLKDRNGRQSWLMALFSTHPPVEARVAALLKGGGHNQ